MTELKTCKTCGQSKALSEFYTQKQKGHNGKVYTVVQPYCKVCQRVRMRVTARQSSLRRRYGLTIEEYDLMSSEQGNKCLICQKICSTGKKLAVDHNQDTGEVRGLLCGNCNQGLGRFMHDVQLLERAVHYLKGELVTCR